MSDRYGYLVNPAGGSSSWMAGKKKWFIIAGMVGVVGVIYWLISRSKVAKIAQPKEVRQEVLRYTVTAPVDYLKYEGAGLPFGIQYYEEVPDCHIETDNNGISRLVTDTGIPGGLIQTVTGHHYFVSEDELNIALAETRELNATVLLAVMPYAMLGPGYLGYCTSGKHIGESVYITLVGQIGRALNKMDGGQLMFVPLDVIDQTPDIWSTYVKPGGE